MTLPEQLERLARDLPALEYGRNAWGAIRCQFPGPVGVDAAEHVIKCIESLRAENAKLRELLAEAQRELDQWVRSSGAAKI